MRFDWAGLLKAALAMGIMPDAFWRLTPVEFRLMAGERDVVGRSRLDELMRAFPDEIGGYDG